MDKSASQTAAIIVTIVASAWVLGGEVRANSAAIEANAKAISELRQDFREFRGLLITHISSGHGAHAPVVAENEVGQ